MFRLALRQTEGQIGSIIGLLGLDLAVPDHSTLYLRPLDVLHGPASVLQDPMKPGAIFTREDKRDGSSHSDRLAQPKRLVNPPFASVH